MHWKKISGIFKSAFAGFITDEFSSQNDHKKWLLSCKTFHDRCGEIFDRDEGVDYNTGILEGQFLLKIYNTSSRL